MSLPEGLLLVGSFAGVHRITYGPNHPRAGQVVAGLLEVRIEVSTADGGSYTRRASFFPDERGDEYDSDRRTTPMQRSLNDLRPEIGDPVAVAVKASAVDSKGRPTGIANLEARKCFALSVTPTRPVDPPPAVSNGKRATASA